MKHDHETQQRAEHEIGHFLVATELGLAFNLYWITLEFREGGDGTSGGSCGIEFLNAHDEELMIKYRLGGIAGQVHGLKSRGEDYLSDEVTRRIFTGGHSDLRGITLAQFEKLFPACLSLVEKNWHRYSPIAADAIIQTTLFDGEPQLILASADNEDVSLALGLYRMHRKPVPPPAEWLENTSPRYPAGIWYENFSSWWGRDGKRDDELIVDWVGRISTVE